MNKLFITSLLALGIVVVPGLKAQDAKPASFTGTLVLGTVSVRTLAKGLTFDATFTKQISSQKDRIGDTITGTIVADVKDATGVVIFPAKAVANIQIMDIMGSDKYHADGSLVLLVRSVNVGNQTFRIQVARDSAAAPTEARPADWTRQPKKLESPTAGVMTGVVGRAPKGTMVGTNLVVTPGTAVTFALAEAVTVTN